MNYDIPVNYLKYNFKLERFHYVVSCREKMRRFVTGAKPPEKRAQMSDSAANYEQEKKKRKPQSAWKVNRPWLLCKEEEEGMVCSYCVDANIPENKTEFIKGCKTARIDSV